MNTIANTVASKLFVAFVAAAMLFTLATPAKAATMEELQAQIAALMAQISSMSGSSATTGTAACTFTRALTVGSEGADVKCLQDALTPTYFNNAGGSTGYFGTVTASAVAAWQAANGVTPAVGYFGPASQAKFAAVVTTPTTPTTPDTDDSEDSDDSSSDLSGEADVQSTDLDSASDDEVEEGEENAALGTLTVEFQDGDAKITRIDVELDATGTEEDAWDTFSEVSIMVDGDVVQTMDASDEDDWQDDEKTLRFSGLDIVAMEDEEMEIEVVATFANSVDNLPATWNLDITSFRYMDADEVATTETPTLTAVSVTLQEAGAEDELTVKTSTTDPDGTTLAVEDNAKSDWFTIFAFDLDTDESVNDISLDEVSLIIDTASSSAAATAFTYADAIDDVELVIDGVTIDDLAVSGGAATTTAAGYDISQVLRFDVDGDVTIDAGDRVTAELRVKFKSLAVATDEGSTVRARVSSANSEAIDAEGADTLEASQLSGAATGDAHTLRTKGINVSAEDTSAVVTVGDSTDDDYATFKIEVEITAFEQDVYISTDPATSITYAIEDGASTATSSGSRTVTLTSTADEVGSTFEITEGSTETLTLSVTYDPSVVTSTAARLQLETIIFGQSSGTPTGQTWTASPDTDYRTAVVTIVD